MNVKLAIAAGILISGFAGGWAVNGWRNDAKEARELRAATKEMNEQAAEMRKFNKENAAREASVLASIRSLNRDIQGIRDEIGRTDVGSARITPDGDRLRHDAHDKATAPGSPGGPVSPR